MDNLECDQSYRTVTHATFKAAMAMLGIDAESLNGVAIGNWAEDDELTWPLTKIMRKNGAFWRIKFSTDFDFSGVRIGYIGIEYPILGED